MKGSEIFSRVLEDLDLYPVFGNPGTTELPMLRNVKDYVLTLHDSIAVGMADGRSQFLKKASLVNLHTLPGLANSMAFIYTAKQNHTPIVITAGQQDTRHMFYDPILYYDLISVIGDAVKYKYEVHNVEDIAPAIKKAKNIALTPPMGPVFLSFPMDVMDQNANYSKYVEHNSENTLLDTESVLQIANRFNAARNPAIVFGYEIDLFNAFKEAEELAEHTGCPVYGEPLSSRSVFNSDHSSYAGDLMPGTTLINLKLLEHDLILFVGGDLTFYPYLPSPPLPGKDLIFVGFGVSNKIGDSYIMNPKLFLKEFKIHAVKKSNFKRPDDLTFANKVAREKKVMGVNYVMYIAKKYFAGYTIVDESISSSYVVRSIFGYGPNRYFTAKSGQLGWANAASLGIAMHSDKVLEIVGDGAFMYTIQSLWTAKKYHLPVKYLVLNNGGYNILKSFAKSYYPELENAEYLTLNLNIENIVKGFGIDVMVADSGLKEIEWLKEGDHAKVLVVNVDKTVPKLFL